jgi:hypothetical protein
MPIVDLASFPNSRIKPRSATQFSIIDRQNVNADTTVELRPLAADRTVCTIGNQSTNTDLLYIRGDGTDIVTKGYILKAGQAIDLEGPESIWVRPIGNPVLVTYDDGRG